MFVPFRDGMYLMNITQGFTLGYYLCHLRRPKPVFAGFFCGGLPGAAAEFARIATAHASLEGHIADQSSGASSTAVQTKSLLKAAALRREKEFRQTAIALKYTIPGLDKSFKMPAHGGDMEVVASHYAVTSDK